MMKAAALTALLPLAAAWDTVIPAVKLPSFEAHTVPHIDTAELAGHVRKLKEDKNHRHLQSAACITGATDFNNACQSELAALAGSSPTSSDIAGLCGTGGATACSTAFLAYQTACASDPTLSASIASVAALCDPCLTATLDLNTACIASANFINNGGSPTTADITNLCGTNGATACSTAVALTQTACASSSAANTQSLLTALNQVCTGTGCTTYATGFTSNCQALQSTNNNPRATVDAACTEPCKTSYEGLIANCRNDPVYGASFASVPAFNCNPDCTSTAATGCVSRCQKCINSDSGTAQDNTGVACSAYCQPTCTEYLKCFELDNPCFPSSATVTKADGTVVRLDTLKKGDAIVATTADGALTTDVVSLLSIAKPEATSAFVTLTMDAGKTLNLTAEHHLPVGEACCANLKKAKDVAVGETVWAVEAGAAAARKVVVKKGLATHKGLHSPVLAGGTFPVVDGVVTAFDGVRGVIAASYGLKHLLRACEATGTCAVVQRMFSALTGRAAADYIA